MMFLERIEVTWIGDCLADAKKIRLKARLPRDISEVFLYLNAVLDNGLYNHHGRTFTFNKEFRRINLYPEELTLTKALNTTDAFQVLDETKALINETYENKDRIAPNYKKRVKPNALQIYELLPKTNCRQCEEPTCLAFAAKLLQGQQNIENCGPLKEPANSGLWEALEELVEVLG
ncbi:Fe-S cluster protein [Metallumcola ferriviriculae]|uniref:Fe-S cluster protein n=1 Tax=Metallumcola ferriviriculae TaxID=3039180 RepID=A0AAU0URE3_9FIRM|nr:Fe-S cluster protein [Desulfitibacteraceae bacterium MK1]